MKWVTRITAGLIAVIAITSAPVGAKIPLELSLHRGLARDQLRALQSTQPGDTIHLKQLLLPSQASEIVDIQLTRVTVFSPDSTVFVTSAKGTEKRPLPDTHHFVGKIQNDEASTAFFSVDKAGNLRGIVNRGDEIFLTELPTNDKHVSTPAKTVKLDDLHKQGDREFSCGTDQSLIQAQTSSSTSLNEATTLESDDSTQQSTTTAETSSKWMAGLIIETDYEFYQIFNDIDAAAIYVADLIAYANFAYQQEIDTRLEIDSIYLYTSNLDPWSETDTQSALFELQDYWNSPPRSDQQRQHVHLISGKPMGGGIAYLDTLCSGNVDIAYAVSAVYGDFSADNPQIIWDSTIVAHEIGHAFGSSHTHNFDYPAVGVGGNAIDCCFTSNTARECYAITETLGPTNNLPGFGTSTGGSPGEGGGGIMSYCHFSAGGFGNVSMTFGTDHLYGYEPQRVADAMRSRASACLPPDNISETIQHSLTTTRSGEGQLSSSPTGIDCGADCSAAFTAGTTVVLSAQADPGSIFLGWDGACSDTSCEFEMDGPKSVTATFSKGLENGSLQAVSGSENTEQRYHIDVPEGATNLSIQISGGTGDADLYASHSPLPTLEQYQCRPYLVGNNEACLHSNTTPGRYHVMLHGFDDFADATLTTNYDPCPYPDNQLTPEGSLAYDRQFNACASINTSEVGFTITSTGEAEFKAGSSISLRPGFRVERGGVFSAQVF